MTQALYASGGALARPAKGTLATAVGRKKLLRQGWMALAACLTLTGCSSAFKLMPAPVYHDTKAFREIATDFYEQTGATTEMEIFFATDRMGQDPDAECQYLRDRGDPLLLGVASVRIGEPGMDINQLSTAISGKEELEISCEGIEELGPLYSTIPPTSQAGVDAFYSTSMDDPIRAPSKAFAQRLNDKMRETRLNEINIFVSGLSTSFGNSIKHATALYHYTLRSGAMVAYPWPVGSTPLSANRDRLGGRVSARALRNLLLFLAENTKAERINLIGYSGGAEVLAYALYQLRLAYAEYDAERIRQDLRIGAVIFASPDADYMEFRNMLMDGLLDMADSTTVYVNPGDRVIVYSEKFSAGAPRLGNPREAISKVEMDIFRDSAEITFVSPENGERNYGVSDRFGHGYWYKNPWVSSDVLMSLTTELSPEERGLVRDEGEVVWQFPDNYVERTETLLEKYKQALETHTQSLEAAD